MSQIKYVGRPPDSDFSVIHKKYADDRYATIGVDTPYIEAQVADQAVGLATPSYVDTQDNLRAKKANVDTADALYVPISSVGQPNGVVGLDSGAYVSSGVLPGALQTSRKPAVVLPATTSIGSEQSFASVVVKGFQAATINIADPGFPYVPLFFATVQGGSKNGSAIDRTVGTGSFGQLTVLRGDDTKWGWCLCTSHKQMAFHNVIPFGDSTINPTSRPPINGASSFGLWLGLWSGSTYTFTNVGFTFYALVMPGF